jgi:hypothetical protein
VSSNKNQSCRRHKTTKLDDKETVILNKQIII